MININDKVIDMNGEALLAVKVVSNNILCSLLNSCSALPLSQKIIDKFNELYTLIEEERRRLIEESQEYRGEIKND